jgi:hemolysin III
LPKKGMKNKDKFAKLFPYSTAEDIANAITHGISTLLAYAGLIYLIHVATLKGTTGDVIAFAVFGSSMIFMFLMSTLYHAIIHITTRDVFKRLDHSAIFIFILGTYVPYIFSALKTNQAYATFAILAAVSVMGIIIKTVWSGKYKILMTFLFIAMGWAALYIMPDLIEELPRNGWLYLMFGGVSYTVGALIYAFAKFKYAHTVWHLFVMGGALFHYLSIAFYLL